MEFNYCRRCGASLTPFSDHGYKCQNGHTLFSNPTPAAGLFLMDGDELILSVRGIEPKKGTLDCFGGFLDGSENFEQALAREMEEEANLSPSDYSRPIYLTSSTSTYKYGGEMHIVVSNLYYAALSPGERPLANDDVASLHRAKINDISVDDIGNDDVKTGFLALRDLFGHS